MAKPPRIHLSRDGYQTVCGFKIHAGIDWIYRNELAANLATCAVCLKHKHVRA